jgi:hypothetical protein
MFCNPLLFPTRLVGDLFLFSDEEEEDAFLSTFEGRKTGWLSHESVAVKGDDEGGDVDAIIFLLFLSVSLSLSLLRMID